MSDVYAGWKIDGANVPRPSAVWGANTSNSPTVPLTSAVFAPRSKSPALVAPDLGNGEAKIDNLLRLAQEQRDNLRQRTENEERLTQMQQRMELLQDKQFRQHEQMQ